MSETTENGPAMLGGVHVAISLIALAGIGVAIFATIENPSRYAVGPLAQARAVAFSSGLFYMLAAGLIHLKIFFELGRRRAMSRLGLQLVIVAHTLIVLAIAYCFAIQRLASRALLVGLDPLLSCAAQLSVFASLAMFATILRSSQSIAPDTRLGLLRSVLFLMAALMLLGSIIWLEMLPLS